ncbi:S8 family serine peptidase [Streptosporangium sp. 'caverna']|uniref:S8 family peptidase n=1 Tax=Streptosporangium sp. 'caverna' TaxID=2202249 RepID=UPI000D7E31D4|nr:S8 family serine peptidase [Streptosporangium sp. 'caverna']AWS41732.1 peptidase S8 [Streptosporangium sp. 'caverna']
MRQRRRTAHGALVLAFVAAFVGSPSIAAAEPAPTPAPPPVPLGVAQDTSPDSGEATARTVTLITGDRVTSFGGRITVKPRHGVQFLRYGDGKHQYVMPSDAIALLRADRLDRRLFDVEELLAGDYDRLPDLPLIVSDSSATRGLTAGRRLAAVDGFAAKTPTADLAKNWPALRTSLTTGKVWLDGQRALSLDVSVPRTGAPVAWAEGLDGTGTTVAVLDSGIDDTHPDLVGKVAGRKNFVTGYEGDNDLNGHGTHVASTVAGSGAASGGRNRGVAPGATLLDGKVCFNYFGQGACPESSILEGMQWAAASGAKVINMSLGAPDSPGVDPLEQAVNDLTAEYGALFVIAAGNDGVPQSIGSPASADAALAVGAVTKTGVVDYYSSRGPRLDDYGVKPEITAPGTDIVAARSTYTEDGRPGEPYIAHSGTSMATPHVAGAAAIITQAHPQWTAEQRKSALVGSARPSPDFDVFAQGGGELDIVRALKQPVSTSPASVNLGFQAFPQGDEDVARTVTYRNTAAAPVTLNLALNGDAPSGLFSLGATSVTVPAGGEASVELSADLDAAGSTYGVFSGRLTATAEGIAVQTPFSVFREEPSADLKVSALDRAGAPAAGSVTMIANHRTEQTFYTMEPEATFRVPMGTYFAATLATGDDGTSTLVSNPNLVVTKAVSLVMDGRKARPVDVTMPERSAAPVEVSVSAEQSGEIRSMIAGISGDDPGALYTADLGTKKASGLTTLVSALFAKPDGKGGFSGSPYTYQAGWHHTGSFTTGFTEHVKQKELATVRAEYAANTTNAAGSVGWRSNTPIVPGIKYPVGVELPGIPLPGTRTEYYVGNTAWESIVQEGIEGADFPTLLAQLGRPATTRAAGRKDTERWNGAVHGLPMTPAYPEYPIVERRVDELLLRLGGYADAEGHLGYSEADGVGGRIAVYRDGKLVGEREGAYAGFDMDPGKARYRLEYSVTAPSLRLSTRRDTVWEFDSAHNASSVALPLTAIGFAPDLDLTNTAKAGRVMTIPITFTRQATAGKVRKVDVDVSFDDGATWQKAPVVQLLGTSSAVVRNPGGPGYVSLRGHVVDSAGNKVTMTVIRAYATK